MGGYGCAAQFPSIAAQDLVCKPPYLTEGIRAEEEMNLFGTLFMMKVDEIGRCSWLENWLENEDF